MCYCSSSSPFPRRSHKGCVVVRSGASRYNGKTAFLRLLRGFDSPEGCQSG